MKNIFRILMAVAVLFTASCAKEDISSSIGGGEVEMTFTVDLPELGTRAYGDGLTATKLKYYVYEKRSDSSLVELRDLCQTSGQTINGSTTVRLALIKGMNYVITFWAANDAAPYAFDGQNVDITYPVAANAESLDAFYGTKEFNPSVDTDTRVELRRPFAQLNAITTDCQKVKLSGITKILKSSIKVKRGQLNDTFNLLTGEATCTCDPSVAEQWVSFTTANIPAETNTIDDNTDMHLAMNYLLVNGEKSLIDVELSVIGEHNSADFPFTATTYTNITVQRNYKTNIIGSLLTKATDFNVEILPGFDAAYDVEGETVTAKVDTAEEFVAAFEDNSNVDVVVLKGDIDLNDLFASLASTRAADTTDPSLTINSGKTLTIDLNGKKLTAVTEIADNNGDGKITANDDNQIIFNILGNLTVKNGNIEYTHSGDNMNWNASTNIFNITAGGVLNLEGVTATNLGGSDMAFVANLNNWGEVTLNVDNCTLESSYVPVRVFNSGPHMNNVTIKNSTLKGVSAAFWVHNYTVADFGTEAKAEAQKALLNLNVYGQGNEFTPDINGIRYGFTNSIRTDAYGITKTVSEDGTEVTLGSIVEDGIVRRGVAGAEENNTIKKAIVSEGVTTLYDRTFRRFYALETVELPSTLTTIGAAGTGVFQSCTALKNIVLPESVTVLGKGTFQECSSLESINIPAGVTRIESDCLRATGLVEVEFHAGVTYFGAQAFRDCKQLKKVVINAPEFTIEANAFGVMAGALPGTVIYVANAEMKAYLESTLAYKNQFTIIAPNSVSTADELIEAVAEGGYIILTADVTVSEAIAIPQGVTATLDLNGKTISSGYQEGSTTKHIYPINNYGELTITGGTIEGRGIYNQDGAKLTINGATVNGLDYNGGACVWSYGTGEVYLNNAIMTGNTGIVSAEGYLEINGGTYTCKSGIDDNGSQLTSPTYNIRAYNGLKITGGTFTSRHGVISVGGGEATIENGSYTIQFAAAITSNVVYVFGDAKMTINNGQFISDDTANKADSGAAAVVSSTEAQLDIYGGTFVGMNGMVSGNVTLYGGTFNTVWDYNHYDKLADKLAEGKTATQNADGSWTVQ